MSKISSSSVLLDWTTLVFFLLREATFVFAYTFCVFLFFLPLSLGIPGFSDQGSTQQISMNSSIYAGLEASFSFFYLRVYFLYNYVGEPIFDYLYEMVGELATYYKLSKNFYSSSSFNKPHFLVLALNKSTFFDSLN